jgi:putative MATE family efflux protein
MERTAVPIDTKGPPARHDLTQGSIVKNLIRLSWPILVTQLLMTLGPTIDTIWVGKLGGTAIAAVGVAGTAVMLAMGLMMGFTMGTLALMARAIGAKDSLLANRVAQQSIVLSAVFAILIALIGQIFGQQIILLITKDPEIVKLGTIYLRIEFFGGATMVFRMMMDTIMQAAGDTFNPMWIAIVYRTFHIILCPFLIFGWWIFPEMGVSGAALTGVISQGLGVVLGLRVLVGERSRVKLSFKDFKFDFGLIWRIVRIGVPSSISGIQRSLSQFFLQVFMAPFGSVALAAHVIAQRVEMFLFMPAMSFGSGAGVLVGQNLGAGKPDRAARSAWIAVGLLECLVVVIGAAMFIWAGAVVHIFSNDPGLDSVAVQYLRIAIVGWLMLGFDFTFMNCLMGAGDTMPAMIVNILVTWLVTIIPAYFLSQYTSIGVLGIRWAMAASVVIGGIAMTIYFLTGKWKKRRV